MFLIGQSAEKQVSIFSDKLKNDVTINKDTRRATTTGNHYAK